MADEIKWRDSLKPGSRVWIHSGYGYRGADRSRCDTVIRVTPKQIVTNAHANGKRYWREDGREVGAEMFAENIIAPASAKDAVEWDQQQAVKKIAEDARWDAEMAHRRELERLQVLAGNSLEISSDSRGWKVTYCGLTTPQVEAMIQQSTAVNGEQP